MVTQATGFELHAPPDKKAAYPAYAFAGYLELLGQKPLVILEPGDLAVLHLFLEGLPDFRDHALASFNNRSILKRSATEAKRFFSSSRRWFGNSLICSV
jgi:hypothetical protein